MTCRVCGSELPEGALFCGECGSSVTAAPLRRSAAQDPRPSDTTVIEPVARREPYRPDGVARSVHVPVPEPLPEPVPAPEPGPDPQSARAVPVSFTLTASTGERIVATGSGLLGRRPIAQPGEEFAQLISIADPERSVSKTHLEFGIDGDEFWVCDRYSANGTVIRPPDAAPRNCEPGRRYRVPRGARVEIGDQFLDLR